VVAVLLFVTWQLATQPVTPGARQLQSDVDFLSNELATLRERFGQIQARNAVLERETDVLRQANRILREQESVRQAELNRLQSELDFFRRLAGTGGAQEGLDVYHVDLLPTASTQVFQFILTLTQNIRRASIVTGRVRIDVEGVMADRPLTLPWSQLGDGNTPEPSFRFKYFQQLEGYLALPEGFSPTRLVLTLEPGGRHQGVQRAYEWDGLLGATAAPVIE
jgi:hypothetical protein